MLGQMIGCDALNNSTRATIPSLSDQSAMPRKARGNMIEPSTTTIGINAIHHTGASFGSPMSCSMRRSWAFSTNPSPRAWARFHWLSTYHMPRPAISNAAKIPIQPPANRSVPSELAEITLWIDGVPGSAVMVKVPAPTEVAAAHRRLGRLASRINVIPNGYMVNTTTNTTTPP